MPTFIKSGYWNISGKKLKGWLNLEELIGNNIPATSGQILRDEYFYFAQSLSSDTVGDWRTSSDDNGFYIQQCTLGNTEKGNGTWVTKLTIQS